MKFNPMSEEEIIEESLLVEGVYDFEVISAEDKLSKAGNEMIVVKLKLWDQKGKERIIWDYLLELMSYKIKHFCESTGLDELYNSGYLSASDCIGKCGKAHIIVSVDKSYLNEKGEPTVKNRVKDYVLNKKDGKKEKNETDNNLNDDIPF